MRGWVTMHPPRGGRWANSLSEPPRLQGPRPGPHVLSTRRHAATAAVATKAGVLRGPCRVLSQVVVSSLVDLVV
jgi:hypothetical protein